MRKLLLGEPGIEQNCAQFCPDDDTIAVGYNDGNIRLYKAASGKLISVMYPLFSSDKMPITGMR